MEAPQDSNNNIDKLKKGLYSRDYHPVGNKISRHLINESSGAGSDWSHRNEEKTEEKPVFNERKKGISFYAKILIVSFVFFLGASSFAFYKFYNGLNSVSADNIEVMVMGPISVSGGEKLSLDIKVYNNNKIDLKSASLQVDYPEGARSSEDLKTEFKRSRDIIGDIPRGESASKRVEAILFGEEKSKKEIKVTIEYRIQGSSAIFYKEKTYEVAISDSPVNIELSGLKEVNSNQLTDFTVTVASNSSNPIRNLLLKAEYPLGFVFSSSDESPINSNNEVWQIGDLFPREKKSVKIYGKLAGQDGEEKVLRFTIGIAGDKDEQAIATPLVTSIATISIKKPFIGIELALDGSSAGDYVSKSGRIIRADVFWKNNLAIPIQDAEILVKFKGDILNKSSVSVDGGFYRSVDNTVIFNKSNNPSLSLISPGQSGNLSFSFGVLNSYSGGEILFKNPSLSLDIIASGKRLQGGNVPQEVLYSATKVVKVVTDTRLNSRAVYSVGPFQNTGSIPPKVDKETTYTVIWTVINTSNKVKNAKVSATLPIYAKWLSKMAPEGENISYNVQNSEIVWELGDIEAGAGIDSHAREVAFQISFLPSVSQIGSSPIILNGAVLTGADEFTSVRIEDARPALDISLKTDPDFKYSDDKVVQ